jgi:NAD(P)-dependent dehydrogenase (short-subunit alcohol dehydrogenase family)
VPSLEGRVAAISGAGSGIGRALTIHFARAGATVLAVDLDEARVEEVAREAEVGRVLPLGADVSTEEGVRLMIDRTVASFGGLDILCNNAGILDRMMPLLETTDEMWERVMRVNLSGPFRACRAALPIMLRQGRGVIINTGSISSFLGGRGGLSYTVSKHGIAGLTRAIATTYGDRGIRCNAIMPGSVKTNIAAGAEPSAEGWELRKKGLATRPEQATPDDIAPIVVFLASDDSRYVNGAGIVADAGWTIY